MTLQEQAVEVVKQGLTLKWIWGVVVALVTGAFGLGFTGSAFWTTQSELPDRLLAVEERLDSRILTVRARLDRIEADQMGVFCMLALSEEDQAMRYCEAFLSEETRIRLQEIRWSWTARP